MRAESVTSADQRIADSAVALELVIVSYRCREMLKNCLSSIAAHGPSEPYRVHVVDNASGDGTAEMVRAEFPTTILTIAEDNLGFSAANNLALRTGSAPYVLLLNPDTRLLPGALDRLLEVVEENPRIGIAGCRLELEDGTFDHAAKRSFPTPLSALGHFTGLGRRPGAQGRLAAYRAPEVEAGPVDAVNGAFMLIRRKALEQVGPFDEGYWMYMEDLDLCYRFRQAGWMTWYEPSATTVHIKAGTSGPNRSFRLNWAFHYGMYRFYRKHYARTHNPFLNFAIYSGILVKLCVAAARSSYRRRLRAQR